MLQSSVDTANTVEKVNLLWYHEMERIFGDRLINEDDREWFMTTVTNVSKRFGEGVDLDKIKKKELGVVFTTALTQETDEIMYEQVDEMKRMLEFLESKMYEYNV